MRLFLLPAALVAILAGVAPAAATGGLGCEAKDANVRFAVDTAITRGMGGAFFEFHATLDLAMDGVPDDFRRLALDEALTHSWLDGEELKLQFYFERPEGGFASLDFLVEAERVEEGLYRGRYVLNVFSSETPYAPEPVESAATGEVVCYVE